MGNVYINFCGRKMEAIVGYRTGASLYAAYFVIFGAKWHEGTGGMAYNV